MPPILSRQVFRQWATRRLLRLSHGLGGCSHFRRGRRQALRLVGLQRLERQLELLGLARQLLRGLPELGPSISRQLEFQPGDLGLAVSASCAIVAMMRFSATRSSGRLSAVIGTPAVDQTCRRFGQ
jgi:hypothetical protein